jgi:hypothetical protein
VLFLAAVIGAALYGWVRGRAFERTMKRVDRIRDEMDGAEA